MTQNLNNLFTRTLDKMKVINEETY
uniref:Uncharacterized protein n=1 Tax=Arundo donax TaxID=35708 RepID=A0A0A8Z4R9_ARUDO